MAATTFERDLEDIRSEMLALRGRRTGKLHWHEKAIDQRRKVVEQVAGFGGCMSWRSPRRHLRVAPSELGPDA